MDFRQRLEQSRIKPDGEQHADTEQQFSCPYFATDRGRSPVCLELRLHDGLRHALPYAFVTEITYEPDDGIQILTNGKRISITGRRLDKLFDYLVAYKVRFIQLNIVNDVGEDSLFVKEILIEEPDYK